MKTERTRDFLNSNGIAMLVADKTESAPEIDRLLEELGNRAKAIPFYAIYPGDGRPPIVFNDVPLLQESLIERLESAGTTPSNVAVHEELNSNPSM